MAITNIVPKSVDEDASAKDMMAMEIPRFLPCPNQACPKNSHY